MLITMYFHVSWLIDDPFWWLILRAYNVPTRGALINKCKNNHLNAFIHFIKSSDMINIITGKCIGWENVIWQGVRMYCYSLFIISGLLTPMSLLKRKYRTKWNHLQYYLNYRKSILDHDSQGVWPKRYRHI